MWFPITQQKSSAIQKGDLLSHGIPLHKNSPVYEVMDVEPDGTIFSYQQTAQPDRIHYRSCRWKNIKPAELVKEKWWYFVEE